MNRKSPLPKQQGQALIRIPNAETQAAMQEAREILKARRAASKRRSAELAMKLVERGA